MNKSYTTGLRRLEMEIKLGIFEKFTEVEQYYLEVGSYLMVVRDGWAPSQTILV